MASDHINRDLGNRQQEAVADLVYALDDEDDEVRWIAAEALIEIGLDGLLTVLSGLVKRSRSINFCRGAQHVLRDFTKIRIPAKLIDKAVFSQVLVAPER